MVYSIRYVFDKKYIWYIQLCEYLIKTYIVYSSIYVFDKSIKGEGYEERKKQCLWAYGAPRSNAQAHTGTPFKGLRNSNGVHGV